MHNFKELIVWKKARQLVKEVYLLTKQFPKEEIFCLTQQIRRAVISIPSNIAEGAGRNSKADYAHFLDIANGSAFEVETQLCLSFDLEYINALEFENINNKIIEIQKMIYKLRDFLKS
ncbi:MAG: four helix bundle protein [Paludibacter sp.]|jgi:four helix bundle protein|nr:four helix bundle protein [Paludibacter sp.]